MVRRAGSPTAPGKPPENGNSGAHRMSYFDDDTDDARYEAVDTHAATEGIVVSLAIGILLWAFIGLGAGWL